MAKLTGSVLGNLSGKLGNLSARTRYGETILAARPSSFNASQAPQVVSVRQKFKVSAALAKAVGAIDDLNTIWDKVRQPPSSAFNEVLKENFPYSDTQSPTAQNIITPGGFDLGVTSSTVAPDSITVELPILNTKANFSADEVTLSVTAILVGYDPTDASNPYYAIMSFNHTEANFDPTAVLEVVMNLDQFQQTKLALYQSKVLLVSAATKDSNSKIVHYSATYGNQS
jgi:hypothetical protein